MPSLDLLLDMTDPEVAGSHAGWSQVAREHDAGRVVHLAPEVLLVGRMPGGTVEGRTTVMFAATLPDGRTVVLETTLRLLENALRALQAAEDRDAESAQRAAAKPGGGAS